MAEPHDSDAIPLKEAIVSVENRYLYSSSGWTYPPILKVSLLKPFRPEGEVMAHLSIQVQDTLDHGQAGVVLERDSALKLIKELVVALDIAPHELADL